MSSINMARVVLGGIVAGVALNISETTLNLVVVAEQMDAALARLNLPPVGGGAIAVFVTLMFALGIMTIWLYAAIRPRYGAGPKAALCAGAAVWFLAYLYPGIGWVTMGVLSTKLVFVSTLWGLVEMLVAALVGASVYKEEPPRALATSR